MSEKLEFGGKSGDHWVSPLIDKARKSNPLVADDVFETMGMHLQGAMSERALNTTQLKDIATQLIGEKASEPLEPEEIQ